MLYLGTSVLILLDLSYLSRFWTCFEAWMAMQTPSNDGLIKASDAERRWTTVPIYGANATLANGLEEVWAGRSAAEAIEVLRRPDVTVTNESDKLIQLGKLQGLDKRVRETMMSAAPGP